MPQCMLLYHPPPDQTPPPPDQAATPPPGPGRNHPPWTRQTPPDQADTPPDQADPPGPGIPPPREADSSIRSTSGRYASYWNAFLFQLCVSVCLSAGGGGSHVTITHDTLDLTIVPLLVISSGQDQRRSNLFICQLRTPPSGGSDIWWLLQHIRWVSGW